MLHTGNKALRDASPYTGVMTREQFLFHEMRITAKLMSDGLDNDTIVNHIVAENLFQYPTEKSRVGMAKACIRRLESMNDKALIEAIATQSSDVAKQICLYAMMRHFRLIWDFMLTVIGEKYRFLDSSFSKADVDTFLMRLQEQDDLVASWSDKTIYKIRQVIIKVLVENEYLDNFNASKLNPVLINPILENSIREAGLEIALPAFNCLS